MNLVHTYTLSHGQTRGAGALARSMSILTAEIWTTGPQLYLNLDQFGCLQVKQNPSSNMVQFRSTRTGPNHIKPEWTIPYRDSSHTAKLLHQAYHINNPTNKPSRLHA